MHFCDRILEHREQIIEMMMHELTLEHLFDTMGRKSRHQNTVRDCPILLVFVCREHGITDPIPRVKQGACRLFMKALLVAYLVQELCVFNTTVDLGRSRR